MIMHARWLVEIATLFVVQSGGSAVPAVGNQAFSSHRYWTVSRQRFERWQGQLSTHRDQLETAGASRRIEIWKVLRPTMEEIFLSDVLTRVVAAFGARLESQGIDADIGPIAHSVFTTQKDVRHRCLRLLMTPGLPVDQAVELNRIRFGLEQWTDTFLAQLPIGIEILPYCFESDRTQDLIQEAADRSTDQAKLVAWQLMSSSCQSWMSKHTSSTSANPQLNQEIGEASLAMLHPGRFAHLSPFPLLASDRINTLIDQADLWVSRLLHAERM